MNVTDVLNQYGRYISAENEILLLKSWTTLSPESQNAIVSGLNQLQEKENSLLSKAFQENSESYNAVQYHISKQRIESLHKNEENNL